MQRLPRLFCVLGSNRSGTSAVELALVLPVFLVLVFGVVTYGVYLATVHGIQQLTAEAARASIAGLSDDERTFLAQDNIAAHVSAYPMLTPAMLTVRSTSTAAATNTFTLTVRYDASGMFIFSLPRLVPSPDPIIVRSASIQRGGY